MMHGQSSDRRDGHRNKRTNAERNAVYDGENGNGRVAAAAPTKRQRTESGKNCHSLMGASTTAGSGQSGSRNGKMHILPEQIRSSYTKLDPIRVIGSGSFGKLR